MEEEQIKKIEEASERLGRMRVIGNLQTFLLDLDDKINIPLNIFSEISSFIREEIKKLDTKQ